MKKVIFMCILALTTLQCSKSSNGGGGVPGAGLPALTPEQKTQVSSFNSSMDTISAVKTSKMGNASTSSTWSNMMGTANSASAPQFDKAQQELIEKMEQAENSYYCQTNVSMPNSTSMTDIPNASIAITGIDCPMNYEMSMNTTILGQSENSVSIQMAITEKFILNDVSNTKPDLNLGLDVTEYANQFKFNMSASGNANSVTMNMNGTGTMTAKSLSAGEVSTSLTARVGMNMIMNSNSNSMNMNVNMSITITQKYADFSAVGHVTASMNSNSESSFDNSEIAGNGKFYINGKEVTETEFEAVFGNSMSSIPMN